MPVTPTSSPETNLHACPPADMAGAHVLVAQIRSWDAELGSNAVHTADVDLSHAEEGLQMWPAQGSHGDTDYTANYGMLRTRPAELVAGTVRAIVVRMPYLPHLADPQTPGNDWCTIE